MICVCWVFSWKLVYNEVVDSIDIALCGPKWPRPHEGDDEWSEKNGSFQRIGTKWAPTSYKLGELTPINGLMQFYING